MNFSTRSGRIRIEKREMDLFLKAQAQARKFSDIFGGIGHLKLAEQCQTASAELNDLITAITDVMSPTEVSRA